jgi:hypothetical protein
MVVQVLDCKTGFALLLTKVSTDIRKEIMLIGGNSTFI